MRTKIFVSAYACEPGLGSEIGVGWHWVLEMSREFELWVLTRESNRRTIEPWIAEHPEYANIHFLYFDLPKWARFWKRGLRGVRTYYNLWQRFANGIVRRTMQQEGISIFHHLTYGNAIWPVSSYGSKQTFIWGPIGGLETIPKDYSRHYGFKASLIEAVRRMTVKFTTASPAFKRRCRRADLIICKTALTQDCLPVDAKAKSVVMTDVAADIKEVSTDVSDDSQNIRCIVVGRLDAWRGFDIAIAAMAEALKNTPNLILDIVGAGMDRERLMDIVDKLGIGENVNFLGKLSMEEYKKYMAQADIVLNPALKEAAVTVSFDAMAYGKPLIALDTTGYTRNFSPAHSIIIPRGEREATIKAFAEAITRIAKDNELRSSMSAAALTAAQNHSWSHHGQAIANLIKSKIKL